MNQQPQYITYVAGSIASDLEVKQTRIGDLTSFRLAVTRTYGERGTNDRGETDFYDVAIKDAGLRASAARELYKGMKIVIQGRAESREYNGKVQYSIWADRIGLVEYLRREQVSAPAAVTTSNTETGDELGF